MAEQKPSAAVRPHPRVRRSATRTGVTHIRHRQPDRYTIIGNHLAQHRELSLTAVGLATYILSLPEGARIDIRTLAARFPEGRDRIAFALRELETQGYLRRVRERTPDGRVVTRTYACNDPGAERAHAGETPPPPPSPPTAPAPPAEPAAEAPRTTPPPHHGRAVTLLMSLRRADDRLTLPEREVRRLAPALAAWLDNGVSPAAVHRTLTAGLPPEVKHPARLLAYWLRELLPPRLPVDEGAPPGLGGADDDARRPRPHPLGTCDGCERAFRAPEPGLCRDCRCGPAGGEAVSAA